MTEEYTYSVSVDFPNEVDIGKLHKEISRDETITTEFHGITRKGDECKLIFAASLSPAEKTRLDGDTSPPSLSSILGAHDSTPLPQIAGSMTVFHKHFTSGSTGNSDDVELFYNDSPGLKIFDVQFLVSSPAPASTLILRDAALGGGRALSDEMSSAANGRRRNTNSDMCASLPQGSSLYVNRSNDNVEGSVIIYAWSEYL